MIHAITTVPAVADVTIGEHGNIVTITLNTDAAIEWVEGNVQAESWQWLGRSLCVDYRFGDALRWGMEDHGLVVEYSR